ncbi:hypothetical protein SteCoe_29268 [Stentor coeruleus]|uniref:RRM domain-containing protein n=1 Tax=Stentor coeruleus TaxID=5963 RepID=A0A1R2B6D5_9CILI|nr:hypothetical protein SteCoe_29268 [Stentor coeruleus]
MEGQKKANWADDSEEESSDQEAKVVHQHKPHIPGKDWKKDLLLERINKNSFPLTLYLNNLSYSILADNLTKEIGLSSQSKIDLVIEGDRCTGFASVKIFDMEDAMKLVEKNGQSICGRTLFVEVGQNRGGDRGRRGGDRRGGRRGGRRQDYEERGNYEKRFDNEKRYENDKKYEKKFERKFENKPKTSEMKGGKITIAPGEESQSKNEPQQAKPKSNPFGSARPVDTLNKDLEFEKHLGEVKQVEVVPGEKDKSYEVETGNPENIEKPEVKKQEPSAEDEESNPKNAFTRGGGRRGGRRGERYRKNYNTEENYHTKFEPRSEAWGENAEENKKDPLEKGQYEGSQHYVKKQNYQDNKRSRGYNQGYRNNDKRDYDTNPEENYQGQYISRYNNKNRPNNRAKAWGDVEEATNILKKPKDVEDINTGTSSKK